MQSFFICLGSLTSHLSSQYCCKLPFVSRLQLGASSLSLALLIQGDLMNHMEETELSRWPRSRWGLKAALMMSPASGLAQVPLPSNRDYHGLYKRHWASTCGFQWTLSSKVLGQKKMATLTGSPSEDRRAQSPRVWHLCPRDNQSRVWHIIRLKI